MVKSVGQECNCLTSNPGCAGNQPWILEEISSPSLHINFFICKNGVRIESSFEQGNFDNELIRALLIGNVGERKDYWDHLVRPLPGVNREAQSQLEAICHLTWRGQVLLFALNSVGFYIPRFHRIHDY